MDELNSATLRPLVESDRDWVTRFTIDRWGAETVVAHGELIYPAGLPGFVATLSGRPVGLVTCSITPKGCEIVTIDSLQPHLGIGTLLVQAAKTYARQNHCRRLWLITTNDNLDGLRFYQRRGFRLVAVFPGAIERSRRLKPEIPAIGNFGIPIRDEIELAIDLDDQL